MCPIILMGKVLRICAWLYMQCEVCRFRSDLLVDVLVLLQISVDIVCRKYTGVVLLNIAQVFFLFFSFFFLFAMHRSCLPCQGIDFWGCSLPRDCIFYLDPGHICFFGYSSLELAGFHCFVPFGGFRYRHSLCLFY